VTLRIIAGEFRGRRIRVPRNADVRPTAERVREALFSILGSRPVGARVLDLYSGSGALGFEALSRGALAVVFCEARGEAIRTVRRNVELLGVDARCRVLPGRVLATLARGRVGGPFELILADPPYADQEVSTLLRCIHGRALLAPDGLIVLERARNTAAACVPGLERIRSSVYGGTRLDFFAETAEIGFPGGRAGSG
jgi:16S rRNA (guanine966-N2)-methyltransferase